MQSNVFQMDHIDEEIVIPLQRNAAQPLADIASKLGLPVTPCSRRIQRMDETGITRKRAALLNSKAISANMSVFVAVRTDQYNGDWLKKFAGMVPDMVVYDRCYRKLIANVKLTYVNKSFAMEKIKYTSALPLTEVDDV